MKLRKSTDYAMRIVLYLAKEDGMHRSSQLAEELEIPKEYLVRVAGKLRLGEVVSTSLGRYGGYELLRKPGQTMLLEVIEAMDEFVLAEDEPVDGYHGCMKCLHQTMFDAIRTSLAHLTVLTVSDLATAAKCCGGGGGQCVLCPLSINADNKKHG